MLSNFFWYVNRLKAMNLLEVGWRLHQKLLQKHERKFFGKKPLSVCSEIFDCNLGVLMFDPNGIGLNFRNKFYNQNTFVNVLKGHDYGRWPMIFSYDLEYKQRDDLGDARTNWEKNRNYEWVLLAKAYYVSNDNIYFQQLEDDVNVWCEKNPFLYGINWTSVMEVAIRSINWMYALAFIQANGKDIPGLRIGIINMVEYLTKHYSRYSSANNHLLVEAAAIGIAGFAFHFSPWKELAIRLLTEELTKQNYSDGVNKELSLHYQTFGMEAYLLLAHISGESRWNNMLKKQCKYVAHAIWKERAVCEFGDDDEGKIVDLQGGIWHQWEWVLQLGSLVTGERYSKFEDICENTRWFFPNEELDDIKNKPLYDATNSKCFKEGGNSFLRDSQDRVLIGIDHAALGFGSIAAHGHADALSFQILVDGNPVFTDPGTYIYHCDIEHRNSFRKTINHNTICIDGKDQSEMLGAFLWGKRANCKLESFSSNEKMDVLTASHDGYKPIIHQRRFEWDKINYCLKVTDIFNRNADWVSTLMLGRDIIISNQTSKTVTLISGDNIIAVDVNTDIDKINIEEAELSPEYGVKYPSKAIRIYGHYDNCIMTIKIKKY